jgi:thioredoxin-like negative regulator of GroEL
VHDEHELARTNLVLARCLLTQKQYAEAQAVLAQCVVKFQQLEAALELQAAMALQATLP